MSTNFGKRVWKLVAQGNHRALAIKAAEELSSKPMHRWIPGEQLRLSGLATITERQALWLHFFFQRHSINASFDPAGPAAQGG